MEETFYKRVDVKDGLPEKCNNATFSEWVTVYSYETCLGEAMYDFYNGCWQFSLDAMNINPPNITAWLKPLPILSRFKLVDKINDIQDKVDAMGFKGQNEYDLHLREEIADYILKSGLPEKKDIEEMIAKLPVGEYSISEPTKEGELWYIHTKDKDFSGSILTEAITNYYNQVNK